MWCAVVTAVVKLTAPRSLPHFVFANADLNSWIRSLRTFVSPSSGSHAGRPSPSSPIRSTLPRPFAPSGSGTTPCTSTLRGAARRGADFDAVRSRFDWRRKRSGDRWCSRPSASHGVEELAPSVGSSDMNAPEVATTPWVARPAARPDSRGGTNETGPRTCAPSASFSPAKMRFGERSRRGCCGDVPYVESMPHAPPGRSGLPYRGRSASNCVASHRLVPSIPCAASCDGARACHSAHGPAWYRMWLKRPSSERISIL